MYQRLNMQLLTRISSGWTTLKFIRVILGVLILYSSIAEGHAGGIVLGVLFTGIALFTDGVCCAAGNCYIPVNKTTQTKSDEIEYEELGAKK